jgi:hypothetical protein
MFPGDGDGAPVQSRAETFDTGYRSFDTEAPGRGKPFIPLITGEISVSPDDLRAPAPCQSLHVGGSAHPQFDSFWRFRLEESMSPKPCEQCTEPIECTRPKQARFCVRCGANRSRQWKRENPEAAKPVPEANAEAQRRWRQNHPELYRLRSRLYAARRRHPCSARVA